MIRPLAAALARSGVALGLSGLLLAVAPAGLAGQEAERDSAATLTGRVVSAMTGGPLPDARVVLKLSQRGAFTDSTGRFTIANVPPGQDTVQVTMIGFADEQLPIQLQPGATTEVTLLLSETVLRMEEITVTVERERTGKLAGFERRRKAGMGHYITPEEIDKMQIRRPSDIVRRVPGIIVGAARLGSAPVHVVRRASRCEPTYFVDGVPRKGLTMDELNRDDILAVEVYRGPAETPPQFQSLGGTCGSIVIWTQEGKREPRQ